MLAAVTALSIYITQSIQLIGLICMILYLVEQNTRTTDSSFQQMRLEITVNWNVTIFNIPKQVVTAHLYCILLLQALLPSDMLRKMVLAMAVHGPTLWETFKRQ